MTSSDWISTKWGEIATLEYGKSLKSYEDSNGVFPVYGTNGLIGFTDKPLCPFPSVIIGRKGAYRGVHFSEKPFFVIDTAFYLKPKDKKLNLKYAYYQLLTQDINSMDSGSAIPSTSREDFYYLEVKLPPPQVQQHIVEILSSIDDKIELNRQTNVTLEAIAQEIFKEWFVNFNFPGATGEMVESELGSIPKGWRIRSLFDSATYINGAAYRDMDFSPDKSGLPVVKITELKYGITPQTNFTRKKLDSKYKIDNGEILFSWSGSPDTSIDIFIWSGGPGWLNQHIFKVLPHNEFERHFIVYLLRQLLPIFIEIARDKQTTGLGHVTSNDMRRLQVIYPPDSIMEGFSKIIAPIYGQILLNATEQHTLMNLRDTLLPKLMNGEIEV